MGNRNLLYCNGCATERWCERFDSTRFRCKECGALVPLIAAKMYAAKNRAAKRAKKRAAMGMPSKTAREQARHARRRPRDHEYLAFIAGYRCIVPKCGVWPVDVHHVKHKSQMGSDRETVPLCHHHHVGVYHGQLGSVSAAREEWGIDLDAMVQAFQMFFEQGTRGPCADLVRGVALVAS